MKQSLNDIWEIRNIPEIYKVFIFIILKGCIVPSFHNFYFYFLKEVKHWSQLGVGFVTIIGNISLLIGSIMYNRYFSNWEFRKSINIANYITIIGGLLGVAFVWNLNRYIGLNDIIIYVLQAFFEDALIMSFVDLPCMVLLAKVTPRHIEGTVFAIFTGALIFTNVVL